MEDVLLCSMSINKYEPLNWLRGGIEDIQCTVSHLVVLSEDLYALLKDRALFDSLFFFCISFHGSLEVGGGSNEVGCVYSGPLDLPHCFICWCLSIVEDLREEGVLVVGG